MPNATGDEEEISRFNVEFVLLRNGCVRVSVEYTQHRETVPESVLKDGLADSIGEAQEIACDAMATWDPYIYDQRENIKKRS